MNQNFDFRTAYIDLLLNVLTGILFIFILTTALVHPESKKVEEGIKKNAEYMITVVWDKNINCDIDTWIRDPKKRTVSFKSKDVELIHLERDDTGFSNDAPLAIAGNSSNPVVGNFDNQEVVVIRGIIPGPYTVNVHGYNCIFEGKNVNIHDLINVSVDVSLIKLNPTIKTIKQKTVLVQHKWDEITAFSFILDQKGEASNFNSDFVNLIKVESYP